MTENPSRLPDWLASKPEEIPSSTNAPVKPLTSAHASRNLHVIRRAGMRRILSAATLVAIIVLGLLVAMRFPQTAAAQNAGAQDPPLSFGNNFFVTGDYVVAGAQNLNASFGNDGFGTGIISFPDGNQGIRGT